jgi:hypothetical protein
MSAHTSSTMTDQPKPDRPEDTDALLTVAEQMQERAGRLARGNPARE